MPNLFDLIGKISNEEMKREIAMMRCVSLSNAMSETGNKVMGKLAKWANMVVNEDKFDYHVVTVKDKMNEQIALLDGLSRAELESRFKNELFLKCHDLDVKMVPETTDNDGLSVWMIREAGKTFLISENVSVANIASQVKDRFKEKMLNRLHKMMVSQTAEQIKRQDQKLQAALNALSIEVMRGLASQVKPQEFSGSGFGKTLRQEAGIEKLSMVVEVMGFECFDVMELRSSVIYELTMSLNPMSRVFLADFVWTALTQYGKKFTYAKDILPSYLNKESEQVLEEEQNFKTDISKRDEFSKRIKEKKDEQNKLKEKLEKAKEQYIKAAEQGEESKKAFKRLESERRLYDEKAAIKSKEQIKQYYAEVTRVSRDKDWAEENCKKIQLQMENLENQIAEQRMLISNMEKEFLDLRKNVDHIIAKKTQQLSMQWKAYFFRFQFDEVIFSTVISQFTIKDRLKLEEYLKEMHDSRNPNAYGTWIEEEEQDGNMTKYHGIKCQLENKRNAKVLYNNTYIRKVWIE